MKVRLGANGVHLFSRGSGLNILFDEFIPPETLWSRAPRQVSIAVTNACDLACSYCYAPKHHSVLQVDRLKSWIDELEQSGSMGLGFGGGEPTLYKQLPEVCAHAAENTTLAVTITTHGHRWNADMVSRYRGMLNMVRVSVDGVEGTYERLRGRSFTRLEAALDCIAADFNLGVNSVINDDTIHDLDALADLAAKHGASEMLLLPEQPTAVAAGASREVLRSLESWILTYDGPVPLATSAEADLSVPIADALPGEVGIRAYAHIDAGGTARASSYATRGVPIDGDGAMVAFARLAEMEAA